MKMFTSRERIIAAMNRQIPDKVPLMCQFSIGSMMTLLKPKPHEFWYDKNVFAEGLVSLCEMFKFDGILVSLHGHSEKWKKDLISIVSIDDGSYKLTFPNRTEIHSLADLPMVSFKQVKVQKTIDEIDIEHDIPSVINYVPVSQNLYFELDLDDKFGVFDTLYAKVGDSVSIHGEITSPFDYLLDLLGYENGLMALIMEPERCKLILGKFTSGLKELAEEMCSKNIDAIKISSPFAGMGFISKDDYREFVLPYERIIIESIRAKGLHVYIHTCGSIDDRLELMGESETSGLECLDPEPVGNVDLEDAFNRIGDKLFIKGNIDSVNSLLFADDKKAEADVKQIIKTGIKMRKGFILSTACSIAPKVTKDRLLMLSRLIDQHGKY